MLRLTQHLHSLPPLFSTPPSSVASCSRSPSSAPTSLPSTSLAHTSHQNSVCTCFAARFLLTTSRKRAPDLSRNIFLWPWAVLQANYADIKTTNGLDAYFFVRFLRFMVRILVPIWLLSWVILLPVFSVGTSSGATDGLTQFQFGNVGGDDQARLWAPLILAWGFTGKLIRWMSDYI